jgi:hypothetical protein
MFQNYLQRINGNSKQIMNMNLIMNQNIDNRNIMNAIVDIPHVVVEEAKKEMLWGQPMWLMLHTLAEKVDPDRFYEVREGLLNIIYIICTNLPCPLCSAHAKEFLNGINFNTIATKDNLKYLLFDFHNLVNSRKKYKTFLYENLNIYETSNTYRVIQNAMFFFTRKSGSFRLIADDMHRKRTSFEINKWFVQNIHFFNS